MPDWGRLSNKRYSDFVRMAKFEKYASAATLALLAETCGLEIAVFENYVTLPLVFYR
mgnify:FL=1